LRDKHGFVISFQIKKMLFIEYQIAYVIPYNRLDLYVEIYRQLAGGTTLEIEDLSPEIATNERGLCFNARPNVFEQLYSTRNTYKLSNDERRRFLREIKKFLPKIGRLLMDFSLTFG
jgi:hypothetical protein